MQRSYFITHPLNSLHPLRQEPGVVVLILAVSGSYTYKIWSYDCLSESPQRDEFTGMNNVLKVCRVPKMGLVTKISQNTPNEAFFDYLNVKNEIFS